MILVAWIAILATGLFTGGSLFCTLVEHPARLDAGSEVALRQWLPSYKRATRLQASLALVGAVAALLDGVFGTGGGTSIVSGLLLASVIPFTLLVVFPVNRQLEEPHRLGSDPGTLTLLQSWGRLQAMRTALALAAFLLQVMG